MHVHVCWDGGGMCSVNGIWTTVRVCEAAGWAKVGEHIESGLKVTDLIVPETGLLGWGTGGAEWMLCSKSRSA